MGVIRCMAAVVAALMLFMIAGAMTAAASDSVDQREMKELGVEVSDDAVIEMARMRTQDTLRELEQFTDALEICTVEYCVARMREKLDGLADELREKLAPLDACQTTNCIAEVDKVMERVHAELDSGRERMKSCQLDMCAEIAQSALNEIVPNVELCATAGCVDDIRGEVQRLAGGATECTTVTCAGWIVNALEPATSACGAVGCTTWVQERIAESVTGAMTVANVRDSLDQIVGEPAPVCGASACIMLLEDAIARDRRAAACGVDYCLNQIDTAIASVLPGFCRHEWCADDLATSLGWQIANNSPTICVMYCEPVLVAAGTLYPVFASLRDNTRREACNAARNQVLATKASADQGYALSASQLANAEQMAMSAASSSLTHSAAVGGSLRDSGTPLTAPTIQTPSKPITGTVYTEDGGPMTNGVVVLSLGAGSYFAGSGAPVLDVEELEAGTFNLEPLVPPAVYDAAADNGGEVMATITVIGDSLTIIHAVNLSLTDLTGDPVTVNPDGVTGALVLGDPENEAPMALYARPGAFGVYCTDRGETRPTGDPNSGQPSGGSGGGSNAEPTASDAQANHGRCVEQHRNHLHVRWTTVGEVHTSSDMSARFIYAQNKHHDSAVSTAFKPNNGSWQLGGSKEMRSETGWTWTSQAFGSNTAYVMKGVLGWRHEGDYRYDSGPKKGQSCGDSETGVPDRMTGEFNWENHPDGTADDNRCKEYDEGNKMRLRNGSSMERNKNSAHTYGNAGEFMGLGYSARSGFSDDVKTRWRGGSNYKWYYLCGRGPDYVDNWTTVYAGPSVH
jgi:hypothetical protein